MDTQHKLTSEAFKMLKASLIRFGNTLNGPHLMALFALLDSMTKMAESDMTGRWAFGLPTGTGKTRAIIEWATAVSKLGLPYTLAVSASRIEALCTLKREMVQNGIPEEMVGLLHDDAKASLPATADNDDRPFMLITHQRIRSKKDNLSQYNLYKGQPRNLLIYDESLMVSDVEHFDFEDLCGSLAHAIEKTKRRPEHAVIANFMTECKAQLEYVYDHYDESRHDLHLIQQPTIDPKVAEHYAKEWEREGDISQFLRAANLDLRMLRSGHSAVVSYRVVVPEELTNMIVLDASYPIRKLCLSDKTIRNAETMPSLKKAGVRSFHSLKRYDNVQLYRLRAFGGRHSMEKRFVDRTIPKEICQVVKTIPESESILFYVYKMNRPGGIDYTKILASSLRKAGVDIHAQVNGQPRISIQTWGNETSLNEYSHCRHVFLVGILHRDMTELMGSYLGQIQNIKGDVDRKLAEDLQLSEKAHLAYQALSRGTCRNVSGGQAVSMTGYLVEVDPEIETTLTQVMPGVTWKTWEPFFVKESTGLIETWVKKVIDHLDGLEDWVDKVSSRSLKKTLKADTIAPRTWAKIIRSVTDQTVHRLKRNHMSQGTVSEWRLQGQSLVRIDAEHFGFKDESGQYPSKNVA